MSAPLTDRALRPAALRYASTNSGGERLIASPLVAWLITAAVVLHLTVSANLLTFVGIPYASPGGLPIEKFHPGTYLTFAGLVMFCRQTPRPLDAFRMLLGQEPIVSWSICFFLACIVYYSVSLGMSGGSVYVESYLSPVVLALMCDRLTTPQLRRLGWIILALLTLSEVIAVGETATHRHLVPYDAGFAEVDADFRGTGLYNHPLSGATITMMGSFLVLAVPLKPAIKFAALGILMVSLVSFGGRTALGITAITLLCATVVFVVRGLIDKSLEPRVLLMVVFGMVAAPVMLFLLVTETSVGTRLVEHLYVDDSAQTRLRIWQIPGFETMHEILFGADTERQESLLHDVGMQVPQNDIENFWLLTFVNIGVVGFVIYLLAFLPYLFYLWRRTTILGCIAIVNTIVVASSSNSLARKSDILYVLTAVVFAIKSFAATAPIPKAIETARPRPERGVVPARTVSPLLF